MTVTPLRLLHTSDVHLGEAFARPAGQGLCPQGKACLCPLESLRRQAIDHAVDAVLIVGDLFDHARVTAELVTSAFELLDTMPAPVVLMCGNHDQHDSNSLYARFESELGDAPKVTFVHDHDGHTFSLFDDALTFWGRAMDDHRPDFRPLHGVPQRPAAQSWYVVLGHGHYVGNEDPMRVGRSSPITAADIAATAADYVALGHWHVMTDVSNAGVTAWYSGSPVTGLFGGKAALVDLVPGSGAKVTAIDIEMPIEGCRAP